MKVEEERGEEQRWKEAKRKEKGEEKRSEENKRGEEKEIKNQLSRKLLVTRIAVNLHLF